MPFENRQFFRGSIQLSIRTLWSINSSDLHRITLKRISSSHFDNRKNCQYVGDSSQCPFMTLQNEKFLAKNMPLFIPLVVPEEKYDPLWSSLKLKITCTEKIAEHVKPISELLEHLKLPSNETIYVVRHKDAGFVVSRSEK